MKKNLPISLKRILVLIKPLHLTINGISPSQFLFRKRRRKQRKRCIGQSRCQPNSGLIVWYVFYRCKGAEFSEQIPIIQQSISE
jgi:hypothetical protein